MSLKTSQTAAIAHMLQGRTVADAAKAAGVTPRTLHRWLLEPEFVAALRAAEGDSLDVAARRLAVVSTAAIGAISAVLADKDTPPALRLRAADLALQHAAKLRELRSFDSRLRALELEGGQ